jgi:hypothetical protein
MRPLVNLASEPFQNRRLLWLAIALLFIIPSILGLQAIKSITTLRADISRGTARVNELEAELKVIEKPAQNNITITPEKNRQLYAASQLRDRRAFSWSQMLNDIEGSLPPGVRVLRVGVEQIQAQGRDGIGGEVGATVLFEVAAKNNKDVTAMIDKFNGTGRFKVFPQSYKQIEGTEEVEYVLKVEYAPPQAEKKPAANNQIAQKQKQ